MRRRRRRTACFPAIWCCEVAATRLLWALGFPADGMYPVRVICRGTPSRAGARDRTGERAHLGLDLGVALGDQVVQLADVPQLSLDHEAQRGREQPDQRALPLGPLLLDPPVGQTPATDNHRRRTIRRRTIASATNTASKTSAGIKTARSLSSGYSDVTRPYTTRAQPLVTRHSQVRRDLLTEFVDDDSSLVRRRHGDDDGRRPPAAG